MLVHLAANLDNWDPFLVDHLARDRHLILLDLPGVGASGGTVPPTLEEASRQAVHIVRSLGHDRVDLLGLSMGGMIAQEVVRHDPELVEYLILVGRTRPTRGVRPPHTPFPMETVEFRIQCIQRREAPMPTMTMRIDEEDAAIVRKYAEFEGKTISDFIRDAVFEKIEDQQDLEALRAAAADDNGERHTHAQVLEELGL